MWIYFTETVAEPAADWPSPEMIVRSLRNRVQLAVEELNESFANELARTSCGPCVCIQELWNRNGSQANPPVPDFTTILAFLEHYHEPPPSPGRRQMRWPQD